VLPAVFCSDYNELLYIKQCRAPPHVAFVEWRGLTTTLLVGALGVENQQNGHLGTSLFPRNLILRVWVTEKVYELKQCQLMN